ncbi:hypothetical protein TNCV_682681 [Trichonephila clavipes]|nr:hypothetical protein TNCV_682681 [Trichonephila clavipes]
MKIKLSWEKILVGITPRYRSKGCTYPPGGDEMASREQDKGGKGRRIAEDITQQVDCVLPAKKNEGNIELILQRVNGK